MDTTELLFLLATGVFAVTGVLSAARQNMDVMSFVIVGVVTAIGGGTLRDLMLDQPLFWLAKPAFLEVAAGAAVATFFFEQRFRATLRGFLYLDAIATSLYTVLAIENTLRLGFAPAVAVVMGVITGIGGGIIRDAAHASRALHDADPARWVPACAAARASVRVFLHCRAGHGHDRGCAYCGDPLQVVIP